MGDWIAAVGLPASLEIVADQFVSVPVEMTAVS